MRISILASLAAVMALLAAYDAQPMAQGRPRGGEEFVSEGVPRMPTPPGPAPKRDLSGAWVGPQNNKPDRVPPMTAAGEAQFKLRKAYGAQDFAETLCIPSEAIEYRDTLARPSGIDAK